MASIDDFIKELQKKLVDPEPFEFEGTYNFMGGVHFQHGKILVGKDLDFAGELKDMSSMCPKHAVKGKILVEGSTARILLEKIPTGMLMRVFYGFEKQVSKDAPEIAGKYNGAWSLEEKGLIGIVKEGNTVNMRLNPEDGNIATLNLYKK